MNLGSMAIAAHREDRLDDAHRYYRLFLQAQPQSGEGWLGLAMLFHMKLGDLEQAAECYRKAVDLLPPAGLADLHLGTVLCELDRQEDAVGPLARYLDATPQAAPSIYSDLACAYVRLGRMDAAHDVAAQCRRCHPDDYFAPFLASWVAARQGHLQEAIFHATDAAALDPMWPVALGLKGLLLWRSGAFAESRRVLQEMVTILAAALAVNVSAKDQLAACRLWREIRRDAKQALGLHEFEPANFVIIKGGLGDQFCLATMLSQFRVAHGGRPLIVFSSPGAKWDMLFPDSADLFVHLEPQQFHQLEICNRLFPDHPFSNFFPFLGALGNLASANEFLRFSLGLPKHVPACRPVIPPAVAASSLDLFHRLGGRPGRSVLVSPLSNSNPMAGHGWWQALVDALSASGFVVFENMTNLAAARPEVLAGAIPVELPLEQVIPFCEAAGHFIGIRSGLCDLLGYARARMKAIHVPRRYSKNSRYPLSVWYDAASSIGVKSRFDSENWQDFDVDGDAAFNCDIIADWMEMPALPA
jgi:tetratricopeptide (TPR) repeat protein